MLDCCCGPELVCFIGAIIMALYFLRKYLQGGQFKKDDIRMDGRVVIVTGANTGIGKETALDLARRGAKIYLGCRDFNRCEQTRLQIIAQTNNRNIFNRDLDLSSLESIRRFAEKFQAEENRLDVLINNAGIFITPKWLTKDGFEFQIGINHMGHFLLTNLLLDLLKKSSPSRIVVVSSLFHANGTINKEDLNSEKSYNRLKAYNQSKLANVLFTRHLAKQLEGTGVTVNALHPGAVNTEIIRYIPPIIKMMIYVIKPIVAFITKSPKSGAQTQIRLAVDPDLTEVTGKYFRDCKEDKFGAAALDDGMAEWLWKESKRWTKLDAKKEN